MTSRKTIAATATLALGLCVAVASPFALAARDEQPIGAAVIIIELTDEDIELQVFADSFDWERLRIYDPDGRMVFDVDARGRLRAQNGMSELFWASEPSHYLVEEPNFDESVEDYLARWPEGEYEFVATTGMGGLIEGEAMLTHDMPALPEITAPVSGDDEEPPVVSPNESFVISWEPVVGQFLGEGAVEIIEYQVILDQTDPERDEPWVDGSTRRALVNLPPGVTQLTVAPEFLLPDAAYEFEILAIEASGNSTISVGEFETSDE